MTHAFAGKNRHNSTSTLPVPKRRWQLLGMKEFARLVQFGLVGFSGLAVDVGVFIWAVETTSPGWARTWALWSAMTWNFAANRWLTFRDCRQHAWYRQYVGYCLSCLMGAAVNWILSLSLMAQFPALETMVWIPLLAGAIAGMGFNYSLCRLWVFSQPVRVQHIQPGEPEERLAA